MQIRFTLNAAEMQRLRTLPEIIDAPMSDPLLMSRLGTVHREQMKEVFATQGATSAGGTWSPLHPRYAARKRKLVGGKKILQLSTDMMRRFIFKGSHGYFERFLPTSRVLGLFQFGAQSDVAMAHFLGNPNTGAKQSALARRIFGGRAKRLQKRDMITKTPRHLAEMRTALRLWYTDRLRQGLRGAAALRGSR